MTAQGPSLVVLAGPNGAGKSTAAPALLKGTLRVNEFVNADVIARGLSAFDADGAALAAGRVLLSRLRESARRRVSFAFETTMASRTFAPWIAGLIASGYSFHLAFLWLPSADFAIARVAERVRLGGHDRPLASTWRVYDNSGALPPRLIAAGPGSEAARAADRPIWDAIRREYGS